MSGSPRTVLIQQPYHQPPYNGPPSYPYHRIPYSPKGGVVHHAPVDKNGYVQYPNAMVPPHSEHPGYFPGMNMVPNDKMRYSTPHPPNATMNGPRGKAGTSPMAHGIRGPVPGMTPGPGMATHRGPVPESGPRPTPQSIANSVATPSPGIQVTMAPPQVRSTDPKTAAAVAPAPPTTTAPSAPPPTSQNNGVAPNITATLLSEEDIKNSASSSGYLPYAKQYELGDEPQRKKFLDVFKKFMEQNGQPCLKVPMADNTNNIPLDLYRLYREVCIRNGMAEVNKTKSWNEVAKAMNIVDDKSSASFLRKQYIKCLFAFECKYDHSLDLETPPDPLRLNHQDLRRGPDMDKQPASKRQATPASEPPTSSQARYPVPNQYYPNTFYPPGSIPHHPSDIPPHNGVPHPPPNTSMAHGYHPSHSGPDQPYHRAVYYGQYPPGHPAHMQGHQHMYMRPPFHPGEVPPGAHPDAWRYRAPYPPGAHPPGGPTYYGEQQIQRYPANAVQPHYNPTPTPRLQVAPAPTKMSSLGRGKEKAKSSESSRKKSSHAQQASSAPAQPPPQPPTPHHPISATSQHLPHMSTPQTPAESYPPTHTGFDMRHHPGPLFGSDPTSVEHTRPTINKRRKLTSKEIGYVETIRMVMSLKSGLLTESAWVLNVLNVLLCDNAMVAYFYLGHHPNLLRMLDRLLDHFQKVLVEIFGEKKLGTRLYSDAKLVGLQPSTKKYKDVAPVASLDKDTEEPYPSLSKNGLKALSYIGIVQDISSNLKLPETFPIDLTEIDKRCNESTKLGGGTVKSDAGKENKKEDGVPAKPCNAVMEELDKIGNKRGVRTETKLPRGVDYENISEDELKRLWERLKSKNEHRVDKESVKLEEDFLFLQSDQDRHLSERCASIMNIFRSLSFIPGNDMIVAHHPGFLLMISQLLSLHHVHYKQCPGDVPLQNGSPHILERSTKRAIKDRENLGLPEHWPFASTLETLRESSFCILANISGQLDFSNFAKSLYEPLVESIVHWVICPSSEAVDPFPPAFLSNVTPQRLMLEALSKMSILQTNLMPIVRSVKSHLPELFRTLVLLLADRGNQVPREFSLVILSNLSQTPGNDGYLVARELAAFPQVISLLLKFLEDAESSAAQFALNACKMGQSSLPPNISQEELCGGTSIDMLRRAALTLIHLAKCLPNKKLFVVHQHRVLSLAMSRFTHPRIGAMIANLLYHMESTQR